MRQKGNGCLQALSTVNTFLPYAVCHLIQTSNFPNAQFPAITNCRLTLTRVCQQTVVSFFAQYLRFNRECTIFVL